MRDDLPHAMRETARRLEPDVVRLAAGGVSRGTRMRRVERAVQVLGSAVAVALVFAGVVVFGPHGEAGVGGDGGAGRRGGGMGGEGQANQAAGSGSGSGTATGNGTATAIAPSTGITPSSIGAAQVSEGELTSALKTVLAGTGISGRSFVAHANPILVDAQLFAHNNVGYIGIVISGPGSSVAPPGMPQVLRDGSVVYVSKEAGSSDGLHDDRIDLSVTLVRTDGTSLAAIETNSSNEKSAAVYGAPLLLAPDQVTTMLDSPAWDAATAAAEALQPSAWGNTSAAQPGTQTSAPLPSGDLDTAVAPNSPYSLYSPNGQYSRGEQDRGGVGH